ncbi:MerR family DNA-binding transcriptional regulator [Rhizophagus irregularis DAOM 181602=DAOM 197198]|uniref:HTH merR-type domain-containing protein n=1 Tax=Rhizophagus irregularis (strain DAOM 197198w) TaxID=1432141 RepID=A0A015LVR0_RHIIW|nr:hypothetical protein RirG_029860 [Rhizophagus irregularis DAOM 197198w]GET61642.1 MerR family DNA-binding transcriptional regulator [Rhizophagus irregularis DAOM 181602=DAOM 197198]
MYLSAHQATKKLDISSDTLRRWLKQGKITAKTSPSGTRLYNISYIFPELTSQNVETTHLHHHRQKRFPLHSSL